jgi:hypothetical protein
MMAFSFSMSSPEEDRVCMVIMGSYILGSDGVARPILDLQVQRAGGPPQTAPFLVDSGADRTVFCADLLALLNLPTYPPSGTTYQGIGGASPIVVVTTVLELPRADGGVATVRGQFAAFTDPQASDISILGRDVLDHFDVIQSRRRNQVLLIAPPHQYNVTPP